MASGISGRVLLESGYPDGVLLEDGSGVLLLEDNAYADAILATAGLVAYWRLGDVSGTMLDSVAGRNGTVNGGVTRGATGALTGTGDKAATFDGSTGYLSVADNAAFDLGDGPFSVEFWAKKALTGTWQQVMDKGAATAAAYGIYFYTDDKLHAEKTNVAEWVASNAADTDTTAFHHWVVTKINGGSGNVYRDGVDVTAGAVTQTLGDSSSSLFIAAFNNAEVAAHTLNGTLDEVAIYNVVLSPVTVAEHFNLGTSGNPRPPYPHANSMPQLLAH